MNDNSTAPLLSFRERRRRIPEVPLLQPVCYGRRRCGECGTGSNEQMIEGGLVQRLLDRSDNAWVEAACTELLQQSLLVSGPRTFVGGHRLTPVSAGGCIPGSAFVLVPTVRATQQ